MHNTTSEACTINGVDLTVFGETVAAIAQTPDLAATVFRSSSRWDDDCRVITTIGNVVAVGNEHRRPTAHVVVTDRPEALNGSGHGPSALELAMSALGACIATTLVAHASSRRIHLRSLEVRMSGAVDLRGVLRLADVRPGFDSLVASIGVEAELSESELRSFVEETLPLSPVLDLFQRGAPVRTELRVQEAR